MIYEFNEAISKMDEIKAEAQVLIPVLKAARAELGEEQANQLILGAIKAWSRERFKQIGAGIPGSPKEKWETYEQKNMARMGKNDLSLVMLRQDSEAVEYNVTRCIYADFFRELGEPELGTALVCDQDFHIAAEIGSPGVGFTRTHSIMEGGNCCDVRWKINGGNTRE